MKANPVTPEHAAQFDEYIVKWQYALNLHDWRIIRGDKPAKGACADVSIGVADHTAVYRLGANFGQEPVNAISLESTAVHELLHVLLAGYSAVVEGKASDEIRMAEEHRIVHTLERLLVPKA